VGRPAETVQHSTVLYGRADKLFAERPVVVKHVVACEYRRSALVEELFRVGFTKERNLVLTVSV
jgi:hypothetical protein